MKIVCSYWVNTSLQWSSGNWTWADCQLLEEICYTWGTANVGWKNGANWWWSECYGRNCVKWGEAGRWWKDTNMLWSQCTMPPIAGPYFLPHPPGVDAATIVQPWLIEPWNPYIANDKNDKKRKHLIKLICKVKGQTYEEEKEAGDMNISVDDIKLAVKKVLDVDLDIKID